MRKTKLFPSDENLRKIEPWQLKNYEKLYKKLLTVPDNMFDMNIYFEQKNGSDLGPTGLTERDYRPECGTCACALGWAPAAGVKVPEDVGGWNEFAAVSFAAPPPIFFRESQKGGIFRYLFDSNRGGTAKQAAGRIKNVLDRVKELKHVG